MSESKEALQKRRDDLFREIARIDDKLEEMRLADIKTKFGVGIGSIVRDSRGTVYKVDAIGHSVGMKFQPMLHGLRKTKSGWAKVKTYIHRNPTIVASNEEEFLKGGA